MLGNYIYTNPCPALVMAHKIQNFMKKDGDVVKL